MHRRSKRLIGLACALFCSWHAAASLDTSPLFRLDLSYPFVDSDRDGMQDAWESSVGLTVGVDDSGGDPDQDGRSNLAEYNAGTDPFVADSRVVFGFSPGFTLTLAELLVDTDGDGMPDAWESANGLSPSIPDADLDPDNDGLSNLAEYNGGWNPQVAEIASRSQSASMAVTLDTGACPYGFGTDTDEDGMPDWWELKYGLNRLVDDADGDLDHDGLSNLLEYRLGMLPNRDDLSGMAWALSLDFLLDTIGISPDTDGDGMRDWWEDLHGLNRLVPDAHLDPDNDGRTNLDEYNANTDPFVNDWLGPSAVASLDFLADTGGFNGGYADDTDGDGMPDWWEIKYALLPTVDDAAGNPDGDALTNIEEYNAGSNPRAFDFLVIDDAEGNIFLLDTGGKFLDSDGDGMPNWWERLYSGTTTGLVASADSDGDGHSNWQEYVSRCNPGDPDSVFHVAGLAIPDAAQPWQWVLTWDTAPDRRYSVFTHTNLTTTWPSAPVYQVDGDGKPKSYTNTFDSSAARFYRLGVRLIRDE